MTDYAVSDAQLNQLRSTLTTAIGQVDAMRANVIAGPVPPETQPPSEGLVVVPATFAWGNTGQVVTLDCAAGKTYAIGYAVPTGWAGQIFHEVLESSTPIGTVRIRLWDSLEPGGPAIPGTLYEGSWIGGTLPAPTWHPGPGQYFFNVQVQDKSGQVGTHQNRYP